MKVSPISAYGSGKMSLGSQLGNNQFPRHFFLKRMGVEQLQPFQIGFRRIRNGHGFNGLFDGIDDAPRFAQPAFQRFQGCGQHEFVFGQIDAERKSREIPRF